MRTLVLSILVVIASASSAMAADPPPKSPEKRVWELTREERLALRFDPSLAAARRAVAVAEGVVSRDDTDPDLNVVIGSRNPEMLMAWELMDHIIAPFTVQHQKRQEEYRSKWTARGAAKYLGDDFWTRLQSVLKPIIDAENEMHRIDALRKSATDEERPAIDAESSRVNALLCPLRAKGLKDARAAFGHEAFERFMYEAVAPDAVVLKSWAKPVTIESLQSGEVWVDEGCQ
jgi:hypothetical protein